MRDIRQTEESPKVTCPHCGGMRLHVQCEQDCGGKTHHFVMCDGCGATGSICDTRDEAVATWNARRPSRLFGWAAADASEPAALPAVASMTVGEMVYGIDWAKGPCMTACAEGVELPSPHDDADGDPQEGLCQNPAKTQRAGRALKEDRTAEYMRYLGYGA